MASLGDRRARVRMEVLGTLWGTLELREAARVLNISASGALIDSPQPAALESAMPVSLVVEGEEVAVETKVRHLRQIVREGEAPRYHIGVEFVAPPRALLRSIEQIASRTGESA